MKKAKKKFVHPIAHFLHHVTNTHCAVCGMLTEEDIGAAESRFLALSEAVFPEDSLYDSATKTQLRAFARAVAQDVIAMIDREEKRIEEAEIRNIAK
jgi:hypothetical protein